MKSITRPQPQRVLPSLRQLRYLTVLATTRNFTRAAEACYVTQSTLSTGLKELEAMLGVQLVERNRHAVRLTPTGEAVVARGRALLAAAEDLVESAAAGGQPMTGTLRLGAIPTIAPFLLPGLLPVLRKHYPAWRLALREDLTARLLSRLTEGSLDMVLMALPYETDGLLVQPLFEDELWLVARAEDPALAGKGITVSPRMAERLLILEEGHCLREHTLEACGRTRVASDAGIEATSLLTLVEMVASGLGVALVPQIALQAGLLASTRLLARPLAAPGPKRTVALVARRSTARSAEFAALAEQIVALHKLRHKQARRSLAKPA